MSETDYIGSNSRIVSMADVERALSFLRDSAIKLGEARQRANHAASMVKHVEALEYKLSDGKNAEARKADARVSERYIAAILEDAIRAGELAKLLALRDAAAATIEMYRTEAATYRSMKL